MIASGYQIYLFSIEKTKECLNAGRQEPRTEETKNQRKNTKNQDSKKEYIKSQISKAPDIPEPLKFS